MFKFGYHTQIQTRLFNQPMRGFSSRLFPNEASVIRDPTKADFSPLGKTLSGGANQYQSPYSTIFPRENRNPQNVPIKRPYERLIKLRKLVRPSRLGKKMTFDAWCVVGDRNGSAGMAHATSTQAAKAVKRALQLARGQLKHYELYEGRTLFHDIDMKYGALRMRLFSKPAGYSIRAQRNAYDVCQAVGMQDIAVQILDGKPNPIKISRAVFHALDNLHQTPAAVANARGRSVKEIQ
ncbi:hypothetical protein MP228_012056 [Amoeboaphelidium protococcarum]|nr:hypothetical protein MP228_012056 [Amoeboaphelidium protococcarum]